MMRRFTGTTIGVAAVLLATGPACAQMQTAVDTAEQKADKVVDRAGSISQEIKTEMSDSWLTAKTKIALYGDERVTGRQIQVVTNNGEVTLRGKVDSEDAWIAAREIARGVEHVRNVRNELQVVPLAARATVDTDDRAIAMMVDQRLRTDTQLKKTSIKARVDAGLVTLIGEVKSVMLSSYATETLSDVPGVRAVRNDLTFPPSGSVIFTPPSGGK